MEGSLATYVSALPTPPDNDFADGTWLEFLLKTFSGVLRPDDPRPSGRLQVADCTMAVGTALSRMRPLTLVTGADALYVADTPHLYRRVEQAELEEWARDLWVRHLGVLGSLSPKQLMDACTMCKVMTSRRVKTVSRRYIAVGEGLFWDADLGRLTGEPTQPVFFKLFDTDRSTKHIRKLRPLTAEELNTVQVEYQRVLDLLRTDEGDLPEEFPFITAWANGSHEVYMDIMRLGASVFMRKKPMGAFMPIGPKRNGKSACAIGLMKTMLGANNCSAVRLSELGDPHYVRALQWTLYNAPDEEDEKPTAFAADFKTLADHGVLSKLQMRSQDPINIDCDFMCCFPMNHEPEWTGSGAAACVQRSLIIPFTHDFSVEDNSADNFAENTFTPEMFSRLLGHFFALATYYMSAPLQFSHRMSDQQASLTEDVDSHFLYRDRFIAFFDGFQSLSILYEDYQRWCDAHELRYVSRKVFKMAFMDFLAQPLTSVRDKKGSNLRCYRIRQMDKEPLMADRDLLVGKASSGAPMFRTPSELHNSTPPLSAVERKETMLEEQFGSKQIEKEVLKAKQRLREVPINDRKVEPTQEELAAGDIWGGLNETKG